MRVPEGWLRQFCDPPMGTEALADRLTMGGLEVEAIEAVAPPFSGVVVASVLSVEPHPKADRLKLCRVDTGRGEPVQIVCGAPNVESGLRVPCALPGAALPGGTSIAVTAVRGVTSHGMLCSARELGLSEDHGGLMVLAPDAPVGADLREALQLDERCLEIKLTPNRGDCLSVFGVAREAAALTGSPLRPLDFTAVAPTCQERLPVRIEAPELCGRFSGRILRGLDARAPTPDWMRRRLERCGLRSISALVDISNYAMLELGRPSHVFDLGALEGGLAVRWARAGETLELLNGREVTLDPGFGVIADGRGACSLAGIMGGEATAVTLATTDVYLEAAFWWPESIQGRSRRLNFNTDAAHRFERGVDYATTVEHIEAITRLILQVCGTARTAVGPVDDQAPRLPARPEVRLRAGRCRAILGMDLAEEEMAAVFVRLGMPHRRVEGGLAVQPPPYRFDLSIEEDLIEEVARVVGYDAIAAQPPRVDAHMAAPAETARSPHDLRHRMVEAGFQELINYSFVDPAWEADFGSGAQPIAVVNPIAAQHAVMRTTLFGGLVAALRFNLDQQARRARVFEVGRVFLADASRSAGALDVAGVDQPMRLGALAYGSADDEQWGVRAREADFFDLKGDLERLAAPLQLRFEAAQHPALHPGRCARVELDGRPVGWLGQLHPAWSQKYGISGSPVLFEVDVLALGTVPLPSPQPVSDLPCVIRDISLWVPEALPSQRLLDEIERLSGRDSRLAVVREVRLIDVFRPDRAGAADGAKASANTLLDKEKSLAFRIVLQDTRRSLSDTEADAVRGAIVQHLTTALGARARE